MILINFHRTVLKPLFGSHARCRFEPSCSDYVKEVFANQPPLEAFKLALFRLSKCHPFGSYGYDPVPGVENESAK